MYMVLLSPRTSPYLTSLQNKKISHKSRHFTPHHHTSHHFTYSHTMPTWIPLLVTTFLTLFLKVFNLQQKDSSNHAGNWFQLLMAVFTRDWSYSSIFLERWFIFPQDSFVIPRSASWMNRNHSQHYIRLSDSSSFNACSKWSLHDLNPRKRNSNSISVLLYDTSSFVEALFSDLLALWIRDCCRICEDFSDLSNFGLPLFVQCKTLRFPSNLVLRLRIPRQVGCSSPEAFSPFVSPENSYISSSKLATL